MTTYSMVADLLLGTIPPPTTPIAAKYVQDATDEVDSKLGLRYVTPIVVDGSDPANRVTPLILKRIANFLASGRFILAQTSPQEQTTLNAYGADLVKTATKALDELENGTIVLPGGTFLNSSDMGISGPVISNLDVESNVESFYTMTQLPPWWPPLPQQPIFPAGAVSRIPYTW